MSNRKVKIALFILKGRKWNMKKKWLFRSLSVIGLTAMAVLLMIAPVLANTTTTTTTPPTPPGVTTNDATYSYMSSTGQAAITFNGSLSIGSYASACVYFEYGLTDTYGYSTAKVAKKSSGTFAAMAITNPTMGQIYNYRADVKYGSTVIHGNNETAVINSSGPSGSSIGASDSFIYFDQLHGGTIFSGADGTAAHPVNNVADILTLLDQTDLSRVFICNGSTFTMTQDISAVSFWGDDLQESSQIDFNGWGGNSVSVHGCSVTGDIDDTGTVDFYDCYISVTDDVGQFYTDCIIGQIDCTGTGNLDMYNCTFDDAEVESSGQGINIRNGSGMITVSGIAVPSYIQGSGLSIILDDTCTGFITIQGNGIDIDNQGLIDVTDLTGGNQKKNFDTTLNSNDETNLFSLGGTGGTGAPIFDLDSMLINLTLAAGDSVTFNLYEDINGSSVLTKSSTIDTTGVYSLPSLFSFPSLASDYITITTTSTLGTTSEVAGTIVFRCN